jgi:DNA-binding transcriptional LysR family regulator
MENKLFLVGGSQLQYSDAFAMKSLLQDMPLIFREEGSATRLYMEEYIKNKGLVVKSKLQLTSNEAVKQAVISGLGVSIMPLIGLKNELENGDIKIIQFEDLPMISNWKLIWLKDKKMSPVAEAYLTYIQAEKSRINESIFSWINNY